MCLSKKKKKKSVHAICFNVLNALLYTILQDLYYFFSAEINKMLKVFPFIIFSFILISDQNLFKLTNYLLQ